MNTVTAEDKQSKPLKEMYLVSIGHGLTHWYPATFYILLPLIGKELGLSYSQIGFIMTIQYIVSSLANLPGGMLVDIIPKKGFLLAASLFWVGFPYLLMSFTSSYLMLLLCVALVGIGNTLWHPTAISTLSQRYPAQKGFVLSVHGMGANIGDAVAPLAVGWLLAFFNWKQVVMWNVLPGLVTAVFILVFLRNLQAATKAVHPIKSGISVGEYLAGLGELFKNRSLLLISTSSAFRSMTQNTVLTYLPLYLAHLVKLPTFWVGFSMFALQAFGFIAALFSGKLSDRMGRKKIIMASMSMTGFVLVLMALAKHSKFFIIFVAFLGFFLYAIRPVMQAWLMDAAPQKMAGTSVGVLFGMQSLGSSIAPLVGGVIADRYGLNATFYFVALTIMLANLLVFLMPGNVGENATPTVSI